MDTDVLVIGAGISGIGAASYLARRRPGTSFTVVEARENIGGTWDLFRYPGVRSDSDLYTFGYEFKPWRDDESIASGDRILAYLQETVDENRLADRIRFGHRVISSDWSSAEQRWTTEVETVATGERQRIRSRWVFSAGGYYRYDQGYSPELPGLDAFEGRVVHPQFWPADLDYAGTRMLVIGSGATAVTLVPNLAGKAASVVMLQRTPSYILPLASRDEPALWLRRVLGDRIAYPLIRRKNVTRQRLVWRISRRFPNRMRRFIRWANVKSLPVGYPVDTHFNPPYQPWDQRLCFVPNGDFFASIRSGDAEVVTDRIRTFDADGVQLESGERIDADIVVTATGLSVQPLGGVALSLDGVPVDVSSRVSFKGMMLSGVPNFAYAIGYTNASWTLKVGLLCEHFVKLLDLMDEKDLATCTPVAPEGLETRPLLDFGAGYIQRVADTLPRQGSAAPWLTSADYRADVKVLRRASVVDPALRFGRRSARTAGATAAGARTAAS
ncbi:flavin-containing monooxygenase [Herbiconiux sp. YIM B11900]|uniref:flavin-containing monooxygenase n=1 Tax=Herbiconiux sp. YIM B11900 TaxID=3404131 RepID=UPI003F858F97